MRATALHQIWLPPSSQVASSELPEAYAL